MGCFLRSCHILLLLNIAIIIGRTSRGIVTSEDEFLHQHASSNNTPVEVAQCPRYSAAVATPGNWLEVSGLSALHYLL